MKDKYNSYCHVEQVKEYTAEDIKNIRKKQEPRKGSWLNGWGSQKRLYKHGKVA